VICQLCYSFQFHVLSKAVLRLMQLVACLSLWRPRFNPRPIQGGFVVRKVALEEVSLSIIAPMLHMSLTRYNPSNWQWCYILKTSVIKKAVSYAPTDSLPKVLNLATLAARFMVLLSQSSNLQTTSLKTVLHSLSFKKQHTATDTVQTVSSTLLLTQCNRSN
jgi:hypothetical protein